MKLEQETMSAQLASELDALGLERDGKTACVVVVTDRELQFIWPPTMEPETIEALERAIVDALLGELGETPWDGPESP